MKTRNASIKQITHKESESRDNSTQKIIIFSMSNSKSRHKRAGTSLVGTDLKITESVSSFAKYKKLEKKEKLRLNKDIMKRLKRRSIHQDSDKLRIFSIDKSRSSLLDAN